MLGVDKAFAERAANKSGATGDEYVHAICVLALFARVGGIVLFLLKCTVILVAALGATKGPSSEPFVQAWINLA